VTVPLEAEEDTTEALTPEQRKTLIQELETRMREAAKAFEFEKAAQFRDRIKALKTSDVYEDAPAARSHRGG
jgi:excinuclease ABC subunit B